MLTAPPDVLARGPHRTAVRARHVGTAALAAVVLLGLFGVLGVRTTTTTATAGTDTLAVTHASVARAGLDVPLAVTLTREGGFTGDVTIAVSNSYLTILDRQNMDPEPSEQAADETWTYMTFTPPDGPTLRADVQAYVRLLQLTGGSGQVAVVADDGTLGPVVDITTRVIP